MRFAIILKTKAYLLEQQQFTDIWKKMVKEGSVAKYVVDGTSSACFEYVGEYNQDENLISYHCKCEKCGKLIHLQCDEVESLRKHMIEYHDFQMDPIRTVFLRNL